MAERSEAKSKQLKVNNGTRELAKALRFTAQDLHLNRSGRISEKQYNKVMLKALFYTLLFGAPVIILLVIALVMQSRGELTPFIDNTMASINELLSSNRNAARSLLAAIGGILLVSMITLFMLFGFVRYAVALISALINGPRVLRYEGLVQLERVQRKVNTGSARATRSGSAPTYTENTFRLKAGGRTFEIDEDIFKLVREDRPYIVYHYPLNPDILAMEVVDG